ncbi:MAG TPA: DNA ligase D [Flavipsychrobacter sp.]|nr:DNA ligase D [Flavipsychrobacter sp.]
MPVKKAGTGTGFSAPPSDISPMLATLVDKPFDSDDWLYEVKWDGYRCIAYVLQGQTELRSRNNKSFNEKFYPLYDAFKAWKMNVILDGEIVVVNEQGISDFGALQNWRSEADGSLLFYAFDILWLGDENLMSLPLTERRKRLAAIIPAKGIIRLSETFDAKGTELFSLADKLHLEGIIAKKRDSIYLPGKRTKEWLKIKTERRQEAVIGGYTINENTPKPFSALLLGVYEGNDFHFICPVGTGFSVSKQKEILQKLTPFDQCPFLHEPDYNKPSRFRPNPPKADVVWVKPDVVVEISYTEETKDGAIRHPSFKGFREDKNAKDVKREVAEQTQPVVSKIEAQQKEKLMKQPAKAERKTLLNPTEETQTRPVQKHDLKFTNLSKVFWPEEGYTKRDMINYYYQVAPYMLPYMKDRPQTLNRFPNGIYGKSFYQKDVTGKVPDWINTYGYYSNGDKREKQFLVCTDEASLLYIASLGCIEMNPWSSKTQTPDNPDWCIIDLDPDGNPFEEVIEAARVIKNVLDAIKVKAFCKTSGSTGIHIYIPLGAQYDYEASKEFGRALMKIVHNEIPSFTSIERLTEKRKGKLYLDFLQNRPQATVAAPYSLRPKPGATVSMPLDWSEVKQGLKMQDFTIRTAIPRLKETGDLFKGVLGKGIDMEKALQKMKSVFK